MLQKTSSVYKQSLCDNTSNHKKRRKKNCRKMSGLINIWTTEFSKLLNRESAKSISAKGSNQKCELIGEKFEIMKLPILQNYYYSDASISMIVHCVSP